MWSGVQNVLGRVDPSSLQTKSLQYTTVRHFSVKPRKKRYLLGIDRNISMKNIQNRFFFKIIRKVKKTPAYKKDQPHLNSTSYRDNDNHTTPINCKRSTSRHKYRKICTNIYIYIIYKTQYKREHTLEVTATVPAYTSQQVLTAATLAHSSSPLSKEQILTFTISTTPFLKRECCSR